MMNEIINGDELSPQEIMRAAKLYELFAKKGVDPIRVIWALQRAQQDKIIGGDFFSSMARHLGVEKALVDEVYTSLRDW